MLTTEEQLDIISRAWGDQDGYCFFPSIRGDAEDKKERILSYQQHRAFHWPQEREAILEHMEKHLHDDLYWCPNLFERDERREQYAMDEQALWADLDEVDPREIEERYCPSVAWETSPGRYQALWLLRPGKTRLNMSWYGNENHRLTAYLSADKGGWDSTQLLRIPGWANHKPERRAANGDKPWRGKLLWKKRGIYRASDFDELPEIEGVKFAAGIVEAEVDGIDHHKVWASVKHKLPTRIQQLVQAKDIAGNPDRSDILWQIERELADQGLSVSEIVAVVSHTVWAEDKYGGRADGFRRLVLEASKAIEFRSDLGTEEKPLHTPLIRIGRALADVKPPDPLIQDIWSRGSCGFIAGEPKSFKSWFALDMAIAVANGHPFLNAFPITEPGPVLYVQEEDSMAMLKKRYTTMVDSLNERRTTKFHEDDGPAGILELGEAAAIGDLPIDMPRYDDDELDRIALDERGLSWLDERLREGQYRAVILDPLMMLAGELVDEKAGVITQAILKPLKQLARKYTVAVIVVHHSNKGSDSKRGGQRMLGSQAFHAWTDDALYLQHDKGNIKVEVESKNDQGGTFTVQHLRNKVWTPYVTNIDFAEAEPEQQVEVHQARRQRKPLRVVSLMEQDGRTTFTARDIAELLHTDPANAYKPLQRAIKAGAVTREGSFYSLNGEIG